jgi:alanyl-tRNA synthetase
LAFAIADGAMPSNEGRGYVLRRILRRAARFGRNINMKEPFIWRLVPVLVDIMGETFPELKEKHQFVSMVVKSEEEGFNSTLDRGLEIFEKIVDQLEKKGGTEIPGSEAFKLYDTYGFPLDLTQLMARQKNLTVDEAGFNAAMKGQRERARSAGKWSYSAEFEYKDWKTLSEGPDSKFVGYETLETEANIRKYQIDGEQIFVTLDLTPFYGEAGGQVGDVGEILGDGFKIRVSDTIRDGNTFVHIGKIDDPTKLNSAAVKASVDAMHRKSVARNHTATHLLHKALRETLGTHVTQAGSLVAPDHLRFDVTHFQKISAEELEKIEARVNQKVREDLAISISQKSYVEARELGAMAIFEEKYGDVVRVVQIDSFSMELCGGTHLKHTGEIGYFRILSESSAAAGIRRLEAVTGRRSDEMLRREKKLTTDLLEVLNCKPDEAVGRIRSLLEEKAQLEKEIKKLRVQSAGSQIEALVSSSKEIDGFRVVASRIDSDDAEELKQIGDELRLKIGSGVGVLASASGTKVSFICVVTDNLIKEKNLRAGDIVKKVAALAGGGGGGRPHMALAGGKDVSKVKLALESVDQIIREFL